MSPPLKHAELPDRFWSKTRQDGDCLIWAGHVMANGYGQFALDGRARLAHRVAYEAAYGEIPNGCDIDHQCRRRDCVNVLHLKAAGRSENNQNQSNSDRRSRSGIRGVNWDSSTGTWQVKMTDRPGHRVHIGRFESIAEAESAAVGYRLKHYPNSLEDRRASTAMRKPV